MQVELGPQEQQHLEHTETQEGERESTEGDREGSPSRGPVKARSSGDIASHSRITGDLKELGKAGQRPTEAPEPDLF